MISIIIACKNAAPKLRLSLQSIQEQTYPAREVIIIDGASTDDTSAVLKEYQALLSVVVSEPDTGIADAFNKGVALATGDFLYFLGAGDIFFDTAALANLMESVGSQVDSFDLIAGKVAMANTHYQIHRIAPATWPTDPHHTLLYKMIYPHQGLLMHQRYFDRYGYFDTRLRYAMDYELLLRSYNDPIRVHLSDTIVAYWLDDGIGAHRTEDVLKEYHHIKQWHRIRSPFFLTILHQWNLFKYWLKQRKFCF